MTWNNIPSLVSLLLLLALAGCVLFDEPMVCPSGRLCFSGTVCAAEQDICIATPCGNHVRDTGEACDDGNIVSGDGCSSDCKSDESCGNSVLDQQAGEACDDGNTVQGDGCRSDCKIELTCGDGALDSSAGEVCDDGNIVSGDGCSSDCISDESCGNGILDYEVGEICDDGNHLDGDGCPGNCRAMSTCLNGVLDPFEACDEGGSTATCDGDCTSVSCGDGFVNPAAGEQCDPPSQTCSATCQLIDCGNGQVEPGEECDDGNLVNTDNCTAVCEFADCTDGFQNADETDVDCGGHCGSDSCGMLQTCSTSEDCPDSRVCQIGICVPDKNHLAIGAYHTCALLDSGAVRCWGNAYYGQLGYGNTNNVGDDESPASAGNVNIGGTVIQLTAGAYHTCALLDSGTVRCWGSGADGRLGYGNTNNIGDNESPASVGNVDIGGTVVRLAAGYSHTCALLATGAVRCWGKGDYGQLGYGNTDDVGDNESPASAGNVNVGGTVVQLVASSWNGGFDGHTCALLDTGAVRCWGKGADGQLGYGDTDNIGDNEPPASAGNVNVGGTVVQLAAGGYHTCALLDTGAVRCWGDGEIGQLGYGNTSNIGDNEAPASAGNVNVGGTAIQLAAGDLYTCAVLNTGAVRCWGHGGAGRLGYGDSDTIGDDESPASAGDVDIGGPVIEVAAGAGHTCAMLDTGAARCWGYNYHGQLGYGHTDTVNSPASVGNINIGGSVTQLAAGSFHTCAAFDSGAVRCWGDGANGRLGYGNTDTIGDNETPATAGNVDLGGSVVQLAIGQAHTCALLDSGAVRCWGWSYDHGRLGYGNTDTIGDDESPAAAGNVNIGGSVIQLAAGENHTCALLDSGGVRCWGFGAGGRLGYGNTNTIGDDETPASAGNVNIGGTVIQITTGAYHTCALLDSGAVRCWGDGSRGALGYGNTNTIGDNESPASAGNVNVGGNVIQLTAGYIHTCALLDTGAVRCWGDARYGQLGYGNTSTIGDDESPASVGGVNVGGSVVQLASSHQHTCALLDSGAVRCWGYGDVGQLGYGNRNLIGDDEPPASAGDVAVGSSVVQLTTGLYHTCALLGSGAVRCWGYGGYGLLGYGNGITIGDDETPASAGDVPIGDSRLLSALSFEAPAICSIPTMLGAGRCFFPPN